MSGEQRHRGGVVHLQRRAVVVTMGGRQTLGLDGWL
jgi:hypothetical protein